MEKHELVAIRNGLSFTQQEMADSLGTGLRQYQKWEGGDAPIRPMVETAVHNIEKLNRTERAIKSARSLQKKCDQYQQALGYCVEKFAELGVSGSGLEDMRLLVAQNKPPLVEELKNLVSGVEKAGPVNDLLIQSLASMVHPVNLDTPESVRVDEFTESLQCRFGEQHLSVLLAWSERHVVRTSVNAGQNLYRMLVKIQH